MTAFLILITHSLFNAGLARLPHPEIYISAFAVAKSLMHLIQSPAMMVRQTVTALIDDKQSFLQVRKFTSILISLIVVVLISVAYTGLAPWIFKNIMGITGKTVEVAVIILRVFVLFPIASTLRNFSQGLAIHFNITPLFTVATIVRIIYVTLIVVFIDKITFLSPGVIAGLMFLGAILIEALVLLLGNKIYTGNITDAITKITNNRSKDNVDITHKFIFSFFWPLIVTSLVKTLTIPIVNMGLARTIKPELALSAFTVAWGFGLIILSPIIMFHQIPINFVDKDNKDMIKIVKKFGLYIGIVITVVFSIISFTNLGYYFLRNIIGVTEEISLLSVDVLKIMVILPFIMLSREFYWGVFIKNHQTKLLGRGKFVNIIFLTITIILLTLFKLQNPAVVGVISIIIGELTEVIYLYFLDQKTK